MPRKPKKRTIDNKLVGNVKGGGAWSRLVKKRAGYRCEINDENCSDQRKIQSHHIVSKQNRRLRYDLRNGVCLCRMHHTLGNQSAHKSPTWFYSWMIDNREEDWDYLLTVENEIKKWDLDEMIKLLEKYEKELKK